MTVHRAIPGDPIVKVLHNTPAIGPMSFGLGQVALNLAREQSALGHDARIWCMSNDDDVQWASRSSGLPAEKMVSFPIMGPPRLGFGPAMLSAAKSYGKDFDVVHQHGIWTACSYVSNVLRKAHGVPTVIAPHGSLQQWALRRSSWKKRLALALYERDNLVNANCLHVLTAREAQDCRSFGLRNPIAIIQNGISATWLTSTGSREEFCQKHSIAPEARIMLFLGRITPKKGLPMFLQAISSHRQQLMEWVLVVAGVDEFDHQRELESLVGQLALEPFVRFVGPQFDQDKLDSFAAANVFVLPSHSEGLPVAILEALGAGVPVLATKASPCGELEQHRCGWCTEISIASISSALQDVLRRSSAELRDMGRRGKQLVSEKYTWPQIAEQTLMLYAWLLDGDCQPSFVVTE